MRVLVVVPPFAGHVNPVVGVAAELAARGHRVAWAGDPDLLGKLLPAGATVHPCAGPVLARPPELRGFAALKHLWDDVLVPLTAAMAPGVEAAVDAERPDVVLADQQAFAGAFAAQRRGIPWATSATTSAELVDPLAGLPAVAARITDQLADLRARHGDPADTADPRFSPHLVIAFTSQALAGEVPGVRFVGPVARPPEPHDFDFSRLDPERPLVYVSSAPSTTTRAPASSASARRPSPSGPGCRASSSTPPAPSAPRTSSPRPASRSPSCSTAPPRSSATRATTPCASPSPAASRSSSPPSATTSR
ncbi:glycosyltransferase [Actinokineospora soli]|uniref:Glycosyltransferase n=1 Tax=Actinokineospora soli TaxID=1048753 RepID=A0ABW2TMT1_9PSEU